MAASSVEEAEDLPRRAALCAGENLAVFTERRRDSLPYYPVSGAKDSVFMELQTGGGAKYLHGLRLAVDICADWT